MFGICASSCLPQIQREYIANRLSATESESQADVPQHKMKDGPVAARTLTVALLRDFETHGRWPHGRLRLRQHKLIPLHPGFAIITAYLLL